VLAGLAILSEVLDVRATRLLALMVLSVLVSDEADFTCPGHLRRCRPAASGQRSDLLPA
jgi:hypothetical protein